MLSGESPTHDGRNARRRTALRGARSPLPSTGHRGGCRPGRDVRDATGAPVEAPGTARSFRP